MHYFFDIHLNGQCHLDEHGQDFKSVEEARRYVITCGRMCLTEGLPRERTLLAQCIIEITDREGVSDVVMLADVIRPHSNALVVITMAWRRARLHPRDSWDARADPVLGSVNLRMSRLSA